MTKNNRDIILCRIAANILYKNIEGIEVSFSKNPLCDLMVEDQSAFLRFGVVVRDRTVYSSQDHAEDVNVLNQRSFLLKEERLPILLMRVDQESETLQFGYLLTWEKYRASIHPNVTWRDITSESWSDLIENLKEMDRVIRVLSDDKISVVKRVAVERIIPNGGIAHGEIIYLRKFTEQYTMKQKEVESEQEKFHRMVFGIPEDEYPTDILDDVILKGIEKVFPNPRKKSQILLLNAELQDLKIDLHKDRKSIHVFVEPAFEELTEHLGQLIGSKNILSIPLSLYYDSNNIIQDYITDETTSVQMSFEKWINEYGLLDYLIKRTLMSINDVITEI